MILNLDIWCLSKIVNRFHTIKSKPYIKVVVLNVYISTDHWV